MCNSGSLGHLSPVRTLPLIALIISAATATTAQDRPAVLIDASQAPRYPEVLKAAGISGVVSAWIIVVPSDSADSAQVRIISSPHRGFNAAVVQGLGRWRYRAAMRGGQPVVDSIRVSVTFATDGAVRVSEVRDENWRELVRAEEDSVVEGPWEVPPDSTWRNVALKAMGKVLEALASRARGIVPIACVNLERFRKPFPVTADELALLQRPGIAVVVPERCPPGFASMAIVEGRVVPPGEDPVRVYATDVQVAGGRSYRIRVEVAGRTSGTRYNCTFDATAEGRPIRCSMDRSWVS